MTRKDNKKNIESSSSSRSFADVLACRRRMMDAFELALQRSTKPDYSENLRIFEALYAEARALGVLPPADPLEGIEVDIALAKALNVRTNS